jgi:pimeloyl-ACP methyl ester carboxylesterase
LALREQLLRCDAAGYVANCRAVRAVDWLDRLSTVRAPTLVIAGGRDVGATPAMARAMAERIPGVQLRTFEDASHLSVAEVPGDFGQAVAEFLK